MWLKYIALFVFLQILHFSNGDLDARIDTLQTQVLELRDEVTELTKIVEDLEKTVKRNIADQKLDKAIAYVLLNNQEKAGIYWSQVVHFLEPNLLNEYLKTLIESSYLGNSKNFYYVLEFLTRQELFIGYTILLKELKNHGELYSGSEIFALAHQIKSACGTNNELYNKIPKVVKHILSGPVLLKNIENDGYMMANETYTLCNSRETCYSNAKSQVFIFRLSRALSAELPNNLKAQWQFVAPTNLSELSEGFYIKNMYEDLYFIFKQRLTGTFLRESTTFEPYYARDMHAQFLPTLVPNASPDENLLVIGVREKFLGKVEYFFSDQFKKVTRVDFSRRPMLQGDAQGFVWEAIPVSDENEESLNNAIELVEMNDKCKFTM